MNKQTKYRKKMHKMGLCVQCGGKLATKWLCRKCADKANDLVKKYYHLKRKGAVAAENVGACTSD